jgi:hypothetical protein
VNGVAREAGSQAKAPERSQPSYNRDSISAGEKLLLSMPGF